MTVEDTGLGIAEEYLPYVFDRFSQESKGLGRSNTGCGLGLSIARELTEMMGGVIQAESVQGKGSKFTIKLPTRPAEYNERITDTQDEPRTEKLAKLLVVEDNVDTQELMLLILQDKFDVTVASTFNEALEVTEDRTYDVVLMDLNLGGKDTGFELLRELRKKTILQ